MSGGGMAARGWMDAPWTARVAVAAGLMLAPAAWGAGEPPQPGIGGGEERVGVLDPHGAAAEGRVEPFPLPDLATAITRLLDQDYLNDAERRALRVKHGAWTAADLEDPASRAAAALSRGAYDDASLSDDRVDGLARAEAALALGDPARALTLTEAETARGASPASLRAIRIRSAALEMLGRSKEADAALDPLVARMRDGEGFRAITDADEVVEGVRGLMARARLRGPNASDGGDFRDMMGMLAYAREECDKLSWSAPLAEAELLRDKDNYAAAVEALQGALARNPRCAEAWALLGEMAVDSMDFPRALSIAMRLDVLAGAGGGLDEKAREGDASIAGALIVARARMRQGDPDEASRVLDAALARRPAQRDLLALQAAASALRYDFGDADARLKALDGLTPGTAEGYYQVGRALSGQRQYEEASRYLEEAQRRAPSWVQPAIELGLLEVQAGRNDEATRALEAAARLDTFNTRAANSLQLMRELRGFASVESAHFVVRYRPGDDEALAREMPPVLEQIYARVCGREKGGIRFEPTGKTVIELMPDHRFFAVRITGMTGVHTIAAATGPLVAMESPREGPNHLTGPYDWRRVIQHEYTHTVTLARTKNRLPHWFTEAAAVYLEDAPRDYRTVELLTASLREGTLFDLDAINVAFARPRKPTDRQLAYAQGHWMYEYIIERYGPEAPLTLMDRYAAGDREAAAFQTVLGVSREAFLSEFKAWARTQVVAWGMEPPAGTPSVRELLARDAGSDADEEDEAAPGGRLWDLAEKWLEEFPNHPQVLRLVATKRLKEAGGKATAALIPLLERCASARPMDPMPHRALAAFYLSGEGASLAEGAEAAIPHLEFLDVREQYTPVYARELARRYAALKRWDEATAKAERAVQISPYDGTLREFAATIALRRGDRTTAERHLRALITLEPTQEIHKRRLEALLARGEKK